MRRSLTNADSTEEQNAQTTTISGPVLPALRQRRSPEQAAPHRDEASSFRVHPNARDTARRTGHLSLSNRPRTGRDTTNDFPAVLWSRPEPRVEDDGAGRRGAELRSRARDQATLSSSRSWRRYAQMKGTTRTVAVARASIGQTTHRPASARVDGSQSLDLQRTSLCCAARKTEPPRPFCITRENLPECQI